MMNLVFEKYHGTGNDFILMDDRENKLQLSREQIEFLCHRRFGIGADGLLLLRTNDSYDFEMVYYNSDGLPGSMCGNGGRCIAAYAFKKGIVKSNMRFIAADGPHEAEIISSDPMEVRLQMSDVSVIEKSPDFYFLDTGSPHVVKFLQDVDKLDVVAEGRKVRNNDRFREKGTNVNFLEDKGAEIFVRTYERGVEDETLSCGTGVTASALAAAMKGILKAGAENCNVRTPGGLLRVHFNSTETGFNQVYLQGPAQFVFAGTVKL